MKIKNKRIKSVSICVVLLSCLVTLGYLYSRKEVNVFNFSSEDSVEEKIYSEDIVLGANESIYQLLIDRGFSSRFIHSLVSATNKVYNLSKLVAGIKLQIYTDKDPNISEGEGEGKAYKDQDLRSMRVYLSSSSYVSIEVSRSDEKPDIQDQDKNKSMVAQSQNEESSKNQVEQDKDNFEFRASVVELPVEVELVSFSNRVDSSLWESARMVGMDSSLIVELADIFAWQVDFAREVRSGDSWKILVEKKKVEGQDIGWGKILAAQYTNQGTLYTGILYNARGSDSYYAPDGSSLKRIFLKSPLKYSRISSRFSKKRFHPVLKIARPHNGVDYAAPIGTPVMSVGDGLISFAGRKGESGIMVKIKHNSKYSTAYLHLKNIAKGIKKGVKVRQSQVIGYVGMTGNTTGPHCHFSFYENSRFVDPLGRKFPAQAGVPKEKMFDFMNHASSVLSKMSELEVARSQVEEKSL